MEDKNQESISEILQIDPYTSGRALYLWETRKSRRLIYIAAIVILALFVGVVYYIKTYNISTPLKLINGGSSGQWFSATKAYNFISAYNLPTDLIPTGVYSISNSTCHTTTYGKWYLSNYSSGSPSIVLNYSKLNQTKPFAEYITIVVVDPAFLNNYTQILGANGYCGNIYKKILTNASYNITSVNFAGKTGDLTKIYNFTDAGLILTTSYYLGPRPDIAWYATGVLYKNVKIGVGVWGSRNYMNASQIIQLTNQTVQAFVLQNP